MWLASLCQPNTPHTQRLSRAGHRPVVRLPLLSHILLGRSPKSLGCNPTNLPARWPPVVAGAGAALAQWWVDPLAAALEAQSARRRNRAPHAPECSQRPRV
jgi:hypothetical protein